VKAFSSFYDALLPELRGCTTALLDFHLRQVARDFCDRTGCWVDTFPTIQMAANTVSYFVLTQEPKSQLVRLLRMTINGVLQWSALPPRPRRHGGAALSGAAQAAVHAGLQPRPAHAGEQPDGDIVLVGSMKPTLAVTCCRTCC
jgi:hypothetical protein